MQCPSCGAANSESSRWCTLCLTKFAPAEPPRPSDYTKFGEALVTAGAEPIAGLRRSASGFSHNSVSASVSRASGITIPIPEHSPPPSAVKVSERASKLGISVEAPGVLTWECKRCRTRNEIDYIDCRVCGWSLFEP